MRVQGETSSRKSRDILMRVAPCSTFNHLIVNERYIHAGPACTLRGVPEVYSVWMGIRRQVKTAPAVAAADGVTSSSSMPLAPPAEMSSLQRHGMDPTA